MTTTYDYTDRTCGIVAEIKIGCSDAQELLLHLTVLREQIKKALKKNPDLLPQTIKVEDNNCYGVHEGEVTIFPDVPVTSALPLFSAPFELKSND